MAWWFAAATYYAIVCLDWITDSWVTCNMCEGKLGVNDGTSCTKIEYKPWIQTEHRELIRTGEKTRCQQVEDDSWTDRSQGPHIWQTDTEFVSLCGGGRRAQKKNERILNPTVKPIKDSLRLPNRPFPLQLHDVCLLRNVSGCGHLRVGCYCSFFKSTGNLWSAYASAASVITHNVFIDWLFESSITVKFSNDMTSRCDWSFTSNIENNITPIAGYLSVILSYYFICIALM